MKKTKKILIINAPLMRGEAEVLLVDIVKIFLEKGHKVTFLNLVDAPELSKKFNEKSNLSFYNIPLKSFNFTPSKFEYFKLLIKLIPIIIFNVIFNKKIKNIYKTSEIIWANAFPASLVAILLSWLLRKKSKIFIYTHHFLKKSEKGLIRKIYEKLLNNYDWIVGVSEKTSDSLRKNFYNIKDKIISIPNGVNTSKFKIDIPKIDLRKKLHLPLEDILGIYVGRFTLNKNQKFLLEVLKKINFDSFKIITIGEGELFEDFIATAKNLKIEKRIIHFGYVPNDQIPLYLKSSDIFICPSKGEGLSIAIIEALISGLPIVMFQDIYSTEFENAVLVAKNNEEFIDFTQSLISNLKLRKDFSERAKEISKKFDINYTAQLYEQLFY